MWEGEVSDKTACAGKVFREKYGLGFALDKTDYLIVCPYCEQDYVLEAKVRKTGQIIRICIECGTVWEGDVFDKIGCSR